MTQLGKEFEERRTRGQGLLVVDVGGDGGGGRGGELLSARAVDIGETAASVDL
jgi:hypothetical protein